MFQLKNQLETLVFEMHFKGISYDEAVREFKKRFMIHVLEHNKGDQCKAAKELRIHRNTIRRILAELGIDPREYKIYSKRKQVQSVLFHKTIAVSLSK